VKAPYYIKGAAGLLEGLYSYYRHGSISKRAWHRLLAAHCASNGRFTEHLNFFTALLRPRRKAREVRGLLGNFSVAQQRDIVGALERDGFYVFDALMPSAICDEIETFAAKAPARPEARDRMHDENALLQYDPSNPVQRVYRIPERFSLAAAGVQRLMADEAFLAIAETYLKSQPVIGGIDVWWSARFGNAPGTEAAQLFHFDFDAPPSWLKLFVYATDVGPDDGPHVYVKGSHRADIPAAREFRARGYIRSSDEEIAAAFGGGALRTITGPRGTVFLADTRGFHKGTLPTGGHRLIAQLIYCSPIFNEHSEGAVIPDNVEPELARTMERHPAVFESFRP
jgi:hypothetical protein